MIMITPMIPMIAVEKAVIADPAVIVLATCLFRRCAPLGHNRSWGFSSV
jgi:hypothetical protein